MKHVLYVGAMSLSLLCSSALAEPQLTDPSPLIDEVAARIFEKINAHRDEISRDPAIAEEIVRADLLPLMDVMYSARLILGRDARQASEAQLKAFADAMNHQLISKYASGLVEFRSREQIEILEFKGPLNPKATRVKTRVKLDSGGYALVDYVFRMTDEGWKVFDVVVEGISYIVSFQSQIKQEINATSLDAVIERITNGDLSISG